ncbi:hypothetical protein QBC42DRAFT_167477 [Cladorrhinum samala]|uniref:Uncharacterized protein n=1 Tax=Cladorrhinum samala TaxID=585594 RepID=A0AAV9I2L2_9PEZI|nr:hypothetical protein QBC42DRAFT_167477 [Cladorrhinum samala]
MASLGPLLGARPLRAGELEEYWPEGRRKEILARGKYLIRNHLEVPPHIKAAYERIQAEDGYGWNRSSADHVNKIIDGVPKRLFDYQIWKRDNFTEPPPETAPAYYDIMRRAMLAEQEFYGFDRDSVGGRLLEQLQLPASAPGSFKHHLKASGISIDKIIHFSRSLCFEGLKFGSTWPTLQLQLQHRRRYFVHDLARYLLPKQSNTKEIKNVEYLIPAPLPKNAQERARYNPDAFLEEGFLNINSRTLVFDTTLNSTLLKLMQEVDLKPGVIIKQFTFWRDGDDDSSSGGRPATWK